MKDFNLLKAVVLCIRYKGPFSGEISEIEMRTKDGEYFLIKTGFLSRLFGGIKIERIS